MFTITIYCLGCIDIILGVLSKSTLFAIVGLVLIISSLLNEVLKPLVLKYIVRVLTALICVGLMLSILLWSSFQPIYDYLLAIIQLFLFPASFLFCDDNCVNQNEKPN